MVRRSGRKSVKSANAKIFMGTIGAIALLVFIYIANASPSPANSTRTQEQSGAAAVLKDGYQEIRMDVTNYGWNPNKFVLKAGVPVKWIINGIELNGCNSAIKIPALNMTFEIKQGLQTIEFTPKEQGSIPFSCLMGMQKGVFVITNTDLSDTQSVQNQLDSAQLPRGGGCGCGG